jgi:hypothetical protein
VAVRVVVPEIDPDVAVIVVEPVVVAMTNPPVVIVETDVLDELQVTEFVRF